MLFRFASLAVFALSLLVPRPPVVAYSIPQNSAKQSSSTAPPKRPSTKSAPSAEEIADAKAKGLVWVNLSTHVYHKGGPLYGNTKRGKFMTEDDAKKGGYRLAKDNEASSKTSSSSSPK